jgi:transposase
MGMVGGLDVHRAQITFDWVEHDTGEVGRGRVAPATREQFRSWLAQLPTRERAFAVEATTGWRFVAEELTRAGFEPHLAEPADTAAARGRKRRAKTDRADAKHLRVLLEQQRLPESWIAPAHILDLRETTRLRHTLTEQRTQWQQRIHAILYHHGVAKPASKLTTAATRQWLAEVDLPAASRHAVAVATGQLDQLQTTVAPIDRWLRAYARRQPGCRALIANHYGIGPITAPTIVAELGDVRRFRNGDAMVRYTGLDVTVYSSDGKRSPGHLARQGPPALRWALFEAAMANAYRASAPDYDYYHQVKDRVGGKRPGLSLARKLARRIRFTLAELGDDALAPVDVTELPDLAEVSPPDPMAVAA